MLGSAIFAALKTEYDRAVDSLGFPATFTVAKTDASIKIPKVGFATIGRDDDALIQAYGVGARVITIKASDVTAPPVKFDRITIGAEVFTFEAVHNVHLPGTGAIIAYRCFSRGK